MSQQPRVLRGQRKIIGAFDQVNPNAAGIDAGSQEHWISVPEDRDQEPVQRFGAFTEDLYRMADWLIACRITTVAIEATGVYWIPLVEVLEARGLEVRLVDSRSIGRRNKKTDVLDCQWIRQLHTFGLLDGAFRPASEVQPLRAYMRQRRMLIEYGSDHIRHMQKALDLMNLKLHTVIDDITGMTGMKIIGAILTGQRNPYELAEMRDPKCKNSVATIAKALLGNYRDEHLFALQVAYDLYATYQAKLRECDNQIEEALKQFDRKAAAATPQQSTTATRNKKRRRKNQPHFDGREMLRQIHGVDLVAIDGLEVSTLLTITSEVGTDLSKFPTEDHFVSWLALSANNRITGGKIIHKRGPKPQPNRAAQAFRLCAQTVARAQNWIGAFFRRMQRKGWAVAVKATAAKLARIFYSMVKNKTEYRPPDVDYYEQRYRANLVKALEKKAQTLGFTLVPAVSVH